MDNLNDKPSPMVGHDPQVIEDRVLGRRLAEIRDRACLTRAELSLMSGVPEDELADYENGSIPLGIGRMRQFASDLDTDAVTLLSRLLFPVSTPRER